MPGGRRATAALAVVLAVTALAPDPGLAATRGPEPAAAAVRGQDTTAGRAPDLQSREAVLAGLDDAEIRSGTKPRARPVLADQPYADGVVLVGYRPGASAAERGAARKSVGALAHRSVSPLAPHVERLRIPRGASVEAAARALSKNPAVRFAQPDYVLRIDATPNDPLYANGTLWNLYGPSSTPTNVYGVNAGAAWAAGHFGSDSVYVGIVDTGVQATHPDLAPNIWTNPFEIAGNGMDDDGNGYVDDVHGWDFFNGDASVYDGEVDFHGTHVAGTIGAAGGNGTGVVGVNWAVTMISAKFIQGVGYTSGAVAALDYITDLKTRHGLNIVATNNSWGGDEYTPALLDAINRGGDAGILFVAAAGNEASDNDVTPVYPPSYECTTRFDSGAPRGYDCLVSVAAIDAGGSRAGFSNYGPTSVDLGAPGVDVASTYPGGYAYLSGTSMAAPHVTGAVALLAACQAASTANGLRDTLLSSAAATASLAGNTVTGGRVDVLAMTSACSSPLAPRAVLGVAPGYVTGSSIQYTLWFSTSVTGLAAEDFTIGGSSSGWAVGALTGTGAGPYSVSVSGASPTDGTLAFSLKKDSVTGDGLLGPPAAHAAVTLIVDRTPPTVSGAAASPGSVSVMGATTISGAGSDAGAVAAVELSVDGGVTWQGMGPTDGAFGETSEAVKATLGGSVAQVTTGSNHACALMTDGTVRCWGRNGEGQLGDGTETAKFVPTPVPGITDAIAVSAGAAHTCVALRGGRVKCWGENNAGQIGTGTATWDEVVSPASVPGITSAIDVSAGLFHSCALLADRSVWCWGTNNGRMGDGTTGLRLAPTKVIGLPPVASVAAGLNHTCALLLDGRAMCWGGAGGFGTLGDGAGIDRVWPSAVSGINDATALDTGEGFHGCSVTGDGTVECWGDGYWGQLGNGNPAIQYAPVQVLGIDTAVAVSTGYSHTCAVLEDTTVRCWGSNLVGQLGDGTTNDSPTPVEVIGVSSAVAISASGYHSCALLQGGAVTCWGNNFSAQMGDGTTIDRSLPGPVTGLTGPLPLGGRTACLRAKDVAGGNGPAASCANFTVTADSVAPAAAIGTPASPTAATTVAFGLGFGEPVTGLAAGDLVRGGTATGCAIAVAQHSELAYTIGVTGCSAGTVTLTLKSASVTDGAGNPGPSGGITSGTVTIDRTGPGVTIPSLSPSSAGQHFQVDAATTATDPAGVATGYVQVDGRGWRPLRATDGTPGGSTEAFTGIVNDNLVVTALAAGGEFTCALIATGRVACWGENSSGQLGDGTMTNRAGAGYVTGLFDATAITAGGTHACARRATGSVVCWGTAPFLNGSSNNTTSTVPVAVALSGVASVSAGANFTCAVLAAGGVRCWGLNDRGQLGNGGPYTEPGITSVVGITTAVEVTTGLTFACARLSDRTIRCWGNATLGDGLDFWQRQWSTTPVVVSGITTATSVSAGWRHTCASLADGTARCWGIDQFGALGTGNQIENSPVQVNGLSGAVSVGVGGMHSCAILQSGGAACWGRNDVGQLGDGSTINRSSATPVSSLAGATLIRGSAMADDVNADAFHTCALLATGGVRCWGANGAGQLGVLGLTGSLVPASTDGLGPANSIGSHQVCVRAVDRAGNASTSPACRTLTVTSAVDTSSPTVSGLRVGAPTGQAADCDNVPVRVSWTGSDGSGSGIVRYELSQSKDGGSTWSVVSTTLTASSMNLTASQRGSRRYRVRAVDAVGHVGPWATSPTVRPRLVQESGPISYSGTWKRAYQEWSCWGYVRWAKTRGATATYTFTGRGIGFMTTLAPTRGKVRIKVDGVVVATIDLYSASYVRRQIVWVRTWGPSRSHTVTIKVLGTSGRPRVDLDAFVVIR